ncbi:MAG: ABC transporter permease subunit [Christensenellales bacterium]
MEARRGHLRHFPDDFGQYLCDGWRTGAGRADCAADGDLSGVLLPEKSVSHRQACGRAAGGHSVGRLRLLRHRGAGADGACAGRTVGRKRQLDAHGVHSAGNHDSADHHRRGRACPSRRFPSYYEGALALGATHERSVYTAVVPAATSGILAGIVLGIGRAMGETMAVIMVAGNQPRMPKGILQGVRTLTGNIVIEMGYAAGLHREALIATGVVLFVFILLINLSFSALKRRKKA